MRDTIDANTPAINACCAAVCVGNWLAASRASVSTLDQGNARETRSRETPAGMRVSTNQNGRMLRKNEMIYLAASSIRMRSHTLSGKSRLLRNCDMDGVLKRRRPFRSVSSRAAVSDESASAPFRRFPSFHTSVHCPLARVQTL